jgi:hypothetical protein
MAIFKYPSLGNLLIAAFMTCQGLGTAIDVRAKQQLLQTAREQQPM